MKEPYIYTVGSLIEKLNTMDKNQRVFVSSDEEMNSVFTKIHVQEYDEHSVVLFGLSGSEMEDED
jgi:nitroimidazol reductase NimA-like FMN-containing flavoprotein (pyridoxamine 5'-phosphate oxidase superfamily)